MVKKEVEKYLYDLISNITGVTLDCQNDYEKELFYYNSKITPAVALFLLFDLSRQYKVDLEDVKKYFKKHSFCIKNIVSFICSSLQNRGIH